MQGQKVNGQRRRESQAAGASVGHLSLSPPYGPMDFAGWFEAFLGGRWYTFDLRNNMPRIGRVLIALGRDAFDVPIAHTFGPNTLVSFKVWMDEVS
jgi:transglutaminase-like putative cysteine protease